jgi:AraC-like DNA-binding protein
VFGDFDLNKNIDNRDFINKHKRLYVSHLLNGNREVITRRSQEEIETTLDDATITKNSEISYFCASSASVVSIGYKAFIEKAKNSLKENEKELKKEGIYESQLKQLFRASTLDTMMQFLRFYELTFIKRYFLKELLNNIHSGSYTTIKEYNSIKRELNFIKLQYDEEVLFFTEGSPKELYKSILEKTNINNLQKNVEELVKNIREDTLIIRDAEVKRNETLILVITSILTILLGYTGIKLIVNDILINLPLIGQIFQPHPLRYTVGIWFSLVIVMISLNIKRWWINK